METKPRLMPLLPLRGMLVFPGMIINLDVGRERSIHAVEAAMTSDKQILLVSQKEAVTMEPGIHISRLMHCRWILLSVKIMKWKRCAGC